jgi:hypothetical protein
MGFRGTRIYLVARTGRLGGRALVVLDGRRRTIDLSSRRTRNRRVVFTRATGRRRAHRLTLIVLGGRVEIDAIAVRRA